MTVINVGSSAINRDSSGVISGRTIVDKCNSANANGKIAEVQIYLAYSCAVLKVGIFYIVSGNNLTTRSWVNLGSVSAGYSSITVDSGSNPLSLTIHSGDYIGLNGGVDGEIDRTIDVGQYWYQVANYIPCTNQDFGAPQSRTISLKGIGATVEVGNIIQMGCNF